MPFEPLRFLHAANVRLDHAIGETDPLPPRVASIVQDATLAAYDRLIATALERRVDFVLLTGNTFIEAEHSLAARLTLVDGFQQLDEEGIRVLVLPGSLDPVDSWRQIPDLPENVAILSDDQKSRVTLKRDGHTIARVGTSLRVAERKTSRASHRELRSQSQRPTAFTIGALTSNGSAQDTSALGDWSACEEQPGKTADHRREPNASADKTADWPVDYVALGGGVRRTIARRCGIAHDPGPLQGENPLESGPCGCTLANVEADGTVRCDFVPTASVRWERFSIDVDASATHADLLRDCRSRLDRFRAESSENAWIFEWILRGSSHGLESLDEDASRRQFQRELAEATTLLHADAALHVLVRQVVGCTAGSVAGNLLPGDPLYADLCEALVACRPGSVAAIAGRLTNLPLGNKAWSADLEALISELELDSIVAHADRFGRTLFRVGAREGAAT